MELKINMKDKEIRRNLNIFKLLQNCAQKETAMKSGSFASINLETDGQAEALHFASLRISPDGQIVYQVPDKDSRQQSVKLRSTLKCKNPRKRCC